MSSKLEAVCTDIDRIKSETSHLAEVNEDLNKVNEDINRLKAVSYAKIAASGVTSVGGGNGSSVKEGISQNNTHVLDHSDKKFNLVIKGLPECQAGLRKHERACKDLEAVVSTLAFINSDLSGQCIRDCFRMGKFDELKCRPMLVKLTRARDVQSILVGRSKLKNLPGIMVKPDLTLEQRQTESILLMKRRELIDSGVGRSDIKLRGNTLYVHKKVYGSVCDSVFSMFGEDVSPDAHNSPLHSSSRDASDASAQSEAAGTS